MRQYLFHEVLMNMPVNISVRPIFHIYIYIYIHTCITKQRLEFDSFNLQARSEQSNCRLESAEHIEKCFLTALEMLQMLQLFRLDRANGVSFLCFCTNEIETRERRYFSFVSLVRKDRVCSKFRTFVQDLLRWSIC